jgi:hypothetical protein
MITELVLLLAIWAFILLGVFLGDHGPIETFKKSAPRLGARIERDIATGTGFYDKVEKQTINWQDPGSN